MIRDGWERLHDELDASRALWSVAVYGIDQASAVQFEFAADRVLKSASAAKIVVLLATAQAIRDGRVRSDDRFSRKNLEPVRDSGVWWHLSQDDLSIEDLSRLVGMVSDNLATNALVVRIGGIAAVTEAARVFGAKHVEIHDLVRDLRTEKHADTLSTGSARGYAELLRQLRSAAAIGDQAAAQVLTWLGDGFDLSMVPASFNLDPLSHHETDRDVSVVNKTGSDLGVRVDTGVISHQQTAIAYAALANWEPGRPDDQDRDEVMDRMTALGRLIRKELLARSV